MDLFEPLFTTVQPRSPLSRILLEHDPIEQIVFVIAVLSRGTVAPSPPTPLSYRTVVPSILPTVAKYDLTLYWGVGSHNIHIQDTLEVLRTLLYAGEKPPHMCWSEFEKRLTRTFNAYVKREGRIVHSDSIKIRMLVNRIEADFSTPTKAQLEIVLLRIPMTITYEQSLALFRNMANQKHHPQVRTVQNRARRQIKRSQQADVAPGDVLDMDVEEEADDKVDEDEARQTRTDSRMITLTNGSQIDYHASFDLPRHTYSKMKREDRDTLKRERAACNQRSGRGGSRSEIQELCTQIQELQQLNLIVAPPADTVVVCSQIPTSNSIMGERNEQANNREACRTATVVTKRHVQSSQSKSWHGPPPNAMVENECDTNADTCYLGRIS